MSRQFGNYYVILARPLRYEPSHCKNITQRFQSETGDIVLGIEFSSAEVLCMAVLYLILWTLLSSGVVAENRYNIETTNMATTNPDPDPTSRQSRKIIDLGDHSTFDMEEFILVHRIEGRARERTCSC